MKKNILIFCILVIALILCFSNTEAYYGGLYGGYGLMGGLMGGYGLMGLMGGYGLMGLMGGYGLMGLMGGYGMYGMMGGMYGMMGGMYSPFSYYNMYYPVQTTGGLTYQVPFMQIAPLLGIAGLYNQLFPNLFNPPPTPAPIVNVTTPATQFVTFPTPIGIATIT